MAEWYTDWFDHPEYELVYQDRDEEEAEELVAFIERTVSPESGTAILDMGCGRGRHARALARRGYHVTGVDLSERAIEQAEKRAAEEGLDVLYFRGDMRRPVCDCCFDGVINVFTAFGYFEDDQDHIRALRAMRRSLRPGGWFLQDYFNVPHILQNLVPEDQDVRDHTEISQRRWVDDGRINKEITLRTNGDEQTFRESVRLFGMKDFERMYDEAGFDIVASYGDYDGNPYGERAPRLILHANKPVSADGC